MDKEQQTPNEDVDLLDILLDEDNEDPIKLFDENGKEYKFDQVALIPLDERLYAILKPLDKIKGVADDEAIVFAVNEKDGEETTLIVEIDESVATRVFDEYYRILDQQGE